MDLVCRPSPAMKIRMGVVMGVIRRRCFRGGDLHTIRNGVILITHLSSLYSVTSLQTPTNLQSLTSLRNLTHLPNPMSLWSLTSQSNPVSMVCIPGYLIIRRRSPHPPSLRMTTPITLPLPPHRLPPLPHIVRLLSWGLVSGKLHTCHVQGIIDREVRLRLVGRSIPNLMSSLLLSLEECGYVDAFLVYVVVC